MSAAVQVGLTESSQRVVASWPERSIVIAEALDRGTDQILAEGEAYVKNVKLSGDPVGLRSGTLRNAMDHRKTRPFEGVIGVGEGPASQYANAILGDQATTITPKNAKHLWVPVADNLNPSGQTRLSPRAAFDQYGKRLRIFRSKAGNLVVFGAEGGRFKRGARKGLAKGKLLFVLKDQVVIEGTDALAEGVMEFVEIRGPQIIDQWLRSVPA
ncbi:MAG: hypothetical protein AAF797_07045 [Planctomycetota bacterium]